MDGNYTAFLRHRVALAARLHPRSGRPGGRRRCVQAETMREGAQPAGGHCAVAGHGAPRAAVVAVLAGRETVRLRVARNCPSVGKAYSASGAAHPESGKANLYQTTPSLGVNLASSLSGLVWCQSSRPVDGGRTGVPDRATAAVGQRLLAQPHWPGGCRCEDDSDAGRDGFAASRPLRGLIGRWPQVARKALGALSPLFWRTLECRGVLVVVELECAPRRAGAWRSARGPGESSL